MRGLYGFICCLCVLVLVVPVFTFHVSASDLENPTLPSETMDSVSESTAPEQETLSDALVGASSDSISLFAARDGDNLEGLASWSISSNLGSITLYASADIDSSAVRVIDGNLMNLSNATVYFYCPEYPSYTFSAARFDNVVYRTDSGYTSYDLQINTIEIDSVDFIDYEKYIMIALAILLLFFVIWGVYKK